MNANAKTTQTTSKKTNRKSRVIRPGTVAATARALVKAVVEILAMEGTKPSSAAQLTSTTDPTVGTTPDFKAGKDL